MASRVSGAGLRKFSGEAKVFHNDVSRASRGAVSRAEKVPVAYTWMETVTVVSGCSVEMVGFKSNWVDLMPILSRIFGPRNGAEQIVSYQTFLQTAFTINQFVGLGRLRPWN